MKQRGMTAKVHQLAEKVGVKISPTHVKDRSYQYDGETIAKNKLSSLLHDIAHFQLASPVRRTIVEFGLGRGPDAAGVKNPPVLVRDGLDEEIAASLLGIAHEAALGMPFWKTLVDHNWDDDNPFDDHRGKTGFFALVIWLQQHGFLEGYVPTAKVRDWPDESPLEYYP